MIKQVTLLQVSPDASKLLSSILGERGVTTEEDNAALVSQLRQALIPKPFACHMCAYRSTRRAHLQQHIRIHTGEKPFKCPHCPYCSSNKSNLRSHRVSIHKEVFAPMLPTSTLQPSALPPGPPPMM